MKQKIILASASPRRRELLAQIGVEFEVFPAKGEEAASGTEPSEVVLELSRQKALEVAERIRRQGRPGKAVILGADTVVAFEGRILGKPKDAADAVRMVEALAGHSHSVFTGVTVVQLDGESQEASSFYEETKVTVSKISRRQAEEYVRTGEPMDKAGAYAIQGRFAAFVEKIEGDYNNVVGLPVARIYRELKKSGIEIL